MGREAHELAIVLVLWFVCVRLSLSVAVVFASLVPLSVTECRSDRGCEGEGTVQVSFFILLGGFLFRRANKFLVVCRKWEYKQRTYCTKKSRGRTTNFF